MQKSLISELACSPYQRLLELKTAQVLWRKPCSKTRAAEQPHDAE